MFERGISRGLSSPILLGGLAIVVIAAAFFFSPQIFGASSKSSQQAVAQGPATGAQNSAAQVVGQVQQVSLKASGSGYDQQVINVKARVPVHLTFSADASAGCGTELIVDGQPVHLTSNNGQSVTADFTPAAGTYAYHCPAGVLPPGKLVAS
ncbi:hypothetical protein HY995_00405 [Candidatus Micrarchaeota archaeon]|nr:hypothetical protein [Candidatus Micrarchaeota archaeon]